MKNKVRFEKNGYLYVEIKNIEDMVSIVKVKNPFQDLSIPYYVELIKIKNSYYIKGYEPKTNRKILKDEI